eukprot:jgi/Mesen1/1825/ME000142S00993
MSNWRDFQDNAMKAADMDEDDALCGNLFSSGDDASSKLLLSRLPGQPGDYATREYWARRYLQEAGTVYNWYGITYEEFWRRHLAERHAAGARLVLEIGSWRRCKRRRNRASKAWSEWPWMLATCPSEA